MAYLLTCSCGKEHTVIPSQAGQELKCSCGEDIRVPTLRGIRELPPVNEEAVVAEVEKSAAQKRVWSGWRGPALATATGIAIITASLATYFLVQRLRIDTSYTADTAIAQGSEILDQYGPYELHYVWAEYQSGGLGPKNRPNYYWWLRYAEDLVFRIAVMGGCSVLFALIALGIWKTAPRQ